MSLRLYVKEADLSTSPIPHLGERSYLQLDVRMTESQRRDAIVMLLGSMPEQTAFQWFRNEFPEWFGLTIDVTDSLRWALDQIQDDLDPDHQAALDAAHAALAKATGDQA